VTLEAVKRARAARGQDYDAEAILDRMEQRLRQANLGKGSDRSSLRQETKAAR
jgi:hypothetical protein